MILKSMSWRELKRGILADELPKDRTKYVRFTNLASINKKMVIYYLKAGFMNPTLRKRYLQGILEEMRRSSNARYDIEDGGNQ